MGQTNFSACKDYIEAFAFVLSARQPKQSLNQVLLFTLLLLSQVSNLLTEKFLLIFSGQKSKGRVVSLFSLPK